MCAQCGRGCCKYTADGMLNQLSMLALSLPVPASSFTISMQFSLNRTLSTGRLTVHHMCRLAVCAIYAAVLLSCTMLARVLVCKSWLEMLCAVQVQVVAAATGRRHLLRKDYGLNTALAPIHTVPPTSLATDSHTTDQLSQMQLAWASEVRAVRHRQLQQTCSAATSTTTFGDVNFDCQFTFVQVGNVQEQLQLDATARCTCQVPRSNYCTAAFSC